MPRRTKGVEVTFEGKPIRASDMKKLIRLEIGKEYVSSSEASELMQVSHETLRRWCEQGRLSGRKYKQAWYYSRADLQRLIVEMQT